MYVVYPPMFSVACYTEISVLLPLLFWDTISLAFLMMAGIGAGSEGTTAAV